MILVWGQSILILAAFFGIGLIIGQASARKPVSRPVNRRIDPEVTEPIRPVASPLPDPMPAPFVAARRAWPLLYPVNQFGVVTVTRSLVTG